MQECGRRETGLLSLFLLYAESLELCSPIVLQSTISCSMGRLNWLYFSDHVSVIMCYSVCVYVKENIHKPLSFLQCHLQSNCPGGLYRVQAAEFSVASFDISENNKKEHLSPNQLSEATHSSSTRASFYPPPLPPTDLFFPISVVTVNWNHIRTEVTSSLLYVRVAAAANLGSPVCSG